MKKIISLLLAVLLVVSAAAIAVNAAGAAEITVAGTDGKTETKTFSVGDTFTVYTTLYSAQFDGKIASLMGSQEYTDSVVALADELDDDGLVKNTSDMFPVANNNNTLANGAIKGGIYFSASEPKESKAFVFDSNDSLLIVTKYTVTAEGKAEINTAVETLATSDLYLTKIISKGVVLGEYDVTIHSSFSYPAPSGEGAAVSGNITSYIDESDVTVKLTGTDNNFTAETTGVTDYSFEAVPAGNYTLSVSKANHVTREYDVTVADAAVAQDVTICPLGDATGDGKTNAQDCTAILRYVRKIDTEMSDYQLKCSDVSGTGDPDGLGDNKVNVQDVTRILRHVRKIEVLY